VVNKFTHKFSYKNPRPEKTVCVVRYGAYGDLMQSSSVWAGLKKQGYHVTLFTSPPGSDVIMNDPNIDRIVLFDKDQVPNGNLGDFWAWHKPKYDKWVNLSESVEGSMLAMPGRMALQWPPAVRHRLMNHNYVEFQHQIAEIPYELNSRFYPTEEERKWARRERDRLGTGPVVLWSLAGSSVHKTWAGLDHIVAAIMMAYPEARVILTGGYDCQILESGWENEKRVLRRSGEWSIRQTLSMAQVSDLVIGPETGVLNAVACEVVPKVVFLSHSTHENLTRDWTNVHPLYSKSTKCAGRGDNAAPACHTLHYGWTHGTRDEETGTAQCQKDIPAEDVWSVVHQILSVYGTHRLAA
jgi:ADP-heptose:LPS heptosyltransferase